MIPESMSQSNDSLSAVLESDLPPGFVDHYGHGIGQIEASSVGLHGHADSL